MPTFAVNCQIENSDFIENPIGVAIVEVTPAYARMLLRRWGSVQTLAAQELPAPQNSLNSVMYDDDQPEFINLYEGWPNTALTYEAVHGVFFRDTGEPLDMDEDLVDEEVIAIQPVSYDTFPDAVRHPMEYVLLHLSSSGVKWEGRSKRAVGTVSTATIPWDVIRPIAEEE